MGDEGGIDIRDKERRVDDGGDGIRGLSIGVSEVRGMADAESLPSWRILSSMAMARCRASSMRKSDDGTVTVEKAENSRPLRVR